MMMSQHLKTSTKPPLESLIRRLLHATPAGPGDATITKPRTRANSSVSRHLPSLLSSLLTSADTKATPQALDVASGRRLHLPRHTERSCDAGTRTRNTLMHAHMHDSSHLWMPPGCPAIQTQRAKTQSHREDRFSEARGQWELDT